MFRTSGIVVANGWGVAMDNAAADGSLVIRCPINDDLVYLGALDEIFSIVQRLEQIVDNLYSSGGGFEGLLPNISLGDILRGIRPTTLNATTLYSSTFKNSFFIHEFFFYLLVFFLGGNPYSNHMISFIKEHLDIKERSRQRKIKKKTTIYILINFTNELFNSAVDPQNIVFSELRVELQQSTISQRAKDEILRYGMSYEKLYNYNIEFIIMII